MNENDIFLFAKNESQLSTSPISSPYKTININSNEHSPSTDSQNKNTFSLSTDSSDCSLNGNISNNNNINMNTTQEGTLLSLNIRSLKRHPSCMHLCEESKSQLTHQFSHISITPVSCDNEIPLSNSILRFDSTPYDMCNDCEYFYLKNNKSKQNSKKQTLGLTYKSKPFPKRNLMSPQEIAFDNEIIKCIQNGNNYNSIENKFSHLLKPC